MRFLLWAQDLLALYSAVISLTGLVQVLQWQLLQAAWAS